jgi:hypothetical protein
MLDKYLNPENINPKHIETAYELLKKYCEKQGVNVVDFVCNPTNIRPAAEYIYKELPFQYKIMLSKDKIENIITNNIEFIKQKVQEFSKISTKLK